MSSIIAPSLVCRLQRTQSATWVLLLGVVIASSAVGQCPGDCDGDGSVAVHELVEAVGIALGQSPPGVCLAADGDADGMVSICELVAAVRASLVGCPTATPTRIETPPQTATQTPNEPPVLPTASIYRTYPGFEIRMPIGAADPGGGPVRCSFAELPVGAALDLKMNELTWTPGADQLGPFYVPYSCIDAAVPPLTANGQLTFKVGPLDGCGMPSCDPAVGCTAALPPPAEGCCENGPAARVAEPVAGCPEGRVLFVGQNQDDRTFGRMQNCDLLRMRNFAQSGADILFNIQARCVSTVDRVRIHARMESNAEFHQLLFDDDTNRVLEPGRDGFASERGLRFGISGPGPFFDLEGAEANLTVTLTDSDGSEVSEQIRLRLTFTPRPDLPDVGDPAVSDAE